MPPTNENVQVVVCSCGKRMKAPGARPGRVGRCPGCGAILEFPSQPSAATTNRTRDLPVAAPDSGNAAPPRPKKKRSAAPIPVATSTYSGPRTAAPDVNPERAGQIDVDRLQAARDAARQVGRGGVLKLPRSSKFGWRDALLYPIWDFAGISWMIFLPFTLGIPYLFVAFLIPIVLRGGNMAIMGPFAFPMIIVLAFALGYFASVLTSIITESSAGEVHHPKWPDIEFGAIVGSLFHWACGLALGLSLGAMPAIQYWQSNEKHNFAARLTVTLLVASGLVYGLMSLAALLLHNALLAANPLTVVNAIFRAGFSYLQTVIIGIATAVVCVLCLEWINRASESFWFLPVAYLAWAVIIYACMVASRSLGMLCHHRRQQIGWFPDRARWGASTDGIDLSKFRDKSGRKLL